MDVVSLFRYEQRAADNFEKVARLVAWHIRPFRTGNITLEVRDTIYRDREVLVTVELFPNDVAVIPIDYSMDQDEMTWDIGNKAGQYFANLREPIPEDFVLGEN